MVLSKGPRVYLQRCVVTVKCFVERSTGKRHQPPGFHGSENRPPTVEERWRNAEDPATDGFLYRRHSNLQTLLTDASPGVSASYLPGAAVATYPMTEPGFASHQPESKVSPVCPPPSSRIRKVLPLAYKTNLVTALMEQLHRCITATYGSSRSHAGNI